MTAISAPQPATFVQTTSWAAGSVATAAISNIIAIYGLFYLSSVGGLDVGTAGVLIFASKLYDAITDPIMGSITDRTRHKMGRRRIYIGIGALLTGFALAIFFGAAGLTNGLSILSALLCLLLLSTAYTIFSVPYLAMPPDLAPTYDNRTKLMSFRVFFIMIGVLIGVVGGPKIIAHFGPGTDGFRVLGIILGLVVMTFGLVAFFGTKGADPEEAFDGSDKEPLSFKSLIISPFVKLFGVLGNAPFRLLTIVKLLQLAVLATALACTPYFFSLVLERSQGDVAKYMGTFTFIGIISIPLLRYVLKAMGKRNSYILFLVIYALVMSSWYFWRAGESEVLFYARAIGLGFSSTGTLLCALSLLPDTMEYDRNISGQSREGIMSGVFTLVEKVSGAIGPLLVGLLLQSQGLLSSTGTGETVEQPESVITAVKIGMSLMPALLSLACIPFLLAYRLDNAALKNSRKFLSQTQAKAS